MEMLNSQVNDIDIRVNASSKQFDQFKFYDKKISQTESEFQALKKKTTETVSELKILMDDFKFKQKNFVMEQNDHGRNIGIFQKSVDILRNEIDHQRNYLDEQVKNLKKYVAKEIKELIHDVEKHGI